MRAGILSVFLVLGSCSQFKASLEQVGGSLDQVFVGSPDSGPSKTTSGFEPENLYAAGRAADEGGDRARAIENYRSAAQLGHPAASYELGVAYGEGRGVERDLERGALWLNRAAELGEPRAQFLIGAAYYGGIGLTQDQALAAAYLAAAAEQGHSRAQFLLAEAFMTGSGVPKDSAWAARLYGKAALQGHPEAQFAYGVAWAAGLGLPVDESNGLAWLTLAAGSGHQKAEAARKNLSARVSKQPRARARRLAEAFRPTAGTRFADPPTVVYVQDRLNRLGYLAGPVDGLAGAKTRAAIEAFQIDHRLAANGALTPELVEIVVKESRNRI